MTQVHITAALGLTSLAFLILSSIYYGLGDSLRKTLAQEALLKEISLYLVVIAFLLALATIWIGFS